MSVLNKSACVDVTSFVVYMYMYILCLWLFIHVHVYGTNNPTKLNIHKPVLNGPHSLSSLQDIHLLLWGTNYLGSLEKAQIFEAYAGNLSTEWRDVFTP